MATNNRSDPSQVHAEQVPRLPKPSHVDPSATTADVQALASNRQTLWQAFAHNRFLIVPDALPRSLVENWRQQALRTIQHARAIARHDGAHDLVYRVVTGEVIRDHWPELFAFYQDEQTVRWVREVTGDAGIGPSARILSAVNLNIMDSMEAVYRWHFDAVPYTLLIYLTDTAPEDGGALEMIQGCGPHEAPDLSVAQIVRHFPAAGTVVLMDGTRCYHRVGPMLRAALRLSIPLVYSAKNASQRPAGLDSYLYEQPL